ncbi:MAG TPA: SsrA-binding protein SmpB [Chitinophagales bacterium]|nr:SsrA-binding protein SmpB [Chitinophagales bacterium]HRK25702.1 SsrA-binding protein SmpB [Chitinophagales bacterium]
MSPQANAPVVVANNKRANFEYFLLEKYDAGIVLTGTEVKSCKTGKVSMSDAYCYFSKGELWLKHMHIAEYKQGGVYNHQPKRDRKLLLKRRELRKLEAKIKERGLTLVPTLVFITENGLVKVEVALAKGKKAFNKKDSIKEKDMRRDLDRSMSGAE